MDNDLPQVEVDSSNLATRPGGVLSDQDIKNEIIQRRLVYTSDGEECWRSDGVKGDAYDLRIGYVLRKGEKPVRSGVVTLRPGQMVTMLSKEWVCLPKNVTGLVVPRNRKARRGLLMLNAGHVDPNWEGQIMGQVVNLSNQERSIRLDDFDDGVFSVVFRYLVTSSAVKPKGRQDPARMDQEEEKRVAGEQSQIEEQAGTLVLAESVMRERFVPRDRLTQLLMTNIVGLLIVVAAVVALATPFVKISDLSPKGSALNLLYGSLIVLGAMSLAVGVIAPLFVWTGRWIGRKVRLIR